MPPRPDSGLPLKTILVVDDDPDSRMICEIILARHGYRVVTSDSGEAGLRMAGAERPSVIILDVALPGLDGWQVAELLKENPETESIPVILYSAHAFDTHMVQGRRLGCAGYLVKPCSPRLIAATVERCLDAQAGESSLVAQPV